MVETVAGINVMLISTGAEGNVLAYFGSGNGSIYYDHIVCSGMEYNLTDCETGTGTRESSHDEDVGVKCNTSKSYYQLAQTYISFPPIS